MNKRRILVVDDCLDLARALAQLLTGWGHEVAVAADGPQALEAASTAHFDVAVLDLELPGMDGFELAERLRRQPGQAAIRLVAMTGRNEDEWQRRVEEVGFDHYLVKPVPPSQLKEFL
jgi:CheY-like chemotaxis protein